MSFRTYRIAVIDQYITIQEFMYSLVVTLLWQIQESDILPVRHVTGRDGAAETEIDASGKARIDGGTAKAWTRRAQGSGIKQGEKRPNIIFFLENMKTLATSF